jgi:hypothetical protein
MIRSISRLKMKQTDLQPKILEKLDSSVKLIIIYVLLITTQNLFV